MTRRFSIPAGLIMLGCALHAIAAAEGPESPKRGLIRHEPGAFAGHTLFAPLRRTTTYLIDMEGRVAHQWDSRFSPGNSAFLLPNGDLLRCARDHHANFEGGGIGGRIQRFDWDGRLVWDYSYSDENKCHHHDISLLPSGNVLVVAWERKTREQAIAAGRNPEAMPEGGYLWPDHVVEVQPVGADQGRIVWEWHSWDHLVQDFAATRANYGSVKDHPELIDINFDRGMTRLPRQETQRLRGLGYVGGGDDDDAPEERRDAPPAPRGGSGGADWHHTNAIDYNPELDQIVLSVLGFNELWIIDHSTTTAQAAGHTGGRGGRGGDLLYRWGNPQAYRAGQPSDQRLFGQHDVQWIDAGLPGAGHLLVFNNGRGRADGEYSSVDQIATPVDAQGRYERSADQPFGPASPCWRYVAEDRSSFFSGHISSAQRLANGNTLICSGEQGEFFEVTPDGRTVWQYRNPFAGAAPEGPPGSGPARATETSSPTNAAGQSAPAPAADSPETPAGAAVGPQIGDTAPAPGAQDGRPAQPGRQAPPAPPAGGGRFAGPPGRGPGGGRGPGSPEAVFRARRIAPNDPGLARLKSPAVPAADPKDQPVVGELAPKPSEAP